MSEAVLSIVVAPLVDQLIGFTISFLAEKYQLLKGVKRDVEKLSSILTSIQAVVQDAEEKQKGSSQVRDWLGKLKEFIYDSEDVLEILATEALLRQRKQSIRFFKCKVAYKLHAADAIKELLERLGDIEKEREKLHLVANVSPDAVSAATRENKSTRPDEHESFIVGREGDKMKVINMLLSEESEREGEISVVPIIGMGGLGKTTLAKLVYNEQQVKDHFQVRMWVSVTKNYDHKKIIQDMMESRSTTKFGVNSLPSTLLESQLLELLGKERFLLVLDDVWNDRFEDWEKLQNVLKHGGKGSKVLVTSRSTRVSEVMGTQPPYCLEGLPGDECWSMFEKIAFPRRDLNGSELRDLKNIGRRIVDKCKGLPLAVRAIAGLLCGNTSEERWRRVLEHDIWKAERDSSGEGVTMAALRLSYDDLSSDLKRCFAYCCLFPKGHVFHKMEVVQLWKAASLIKPDGRYKLDETGSEYFDELLSRSLFQVSDVSSKLDELSEIAKEKFDEMLSLSQLPHDQPTYWMHDLIHDLAQSVSSPYCHQIMNYNDGVNMPNKVRHVALHCKDSQQQIMDELSEVKKLRTLISPIQYSRKIGPALDKLFRSCKYVRNLDLRSSLITELPESIAELILLRYLDLSNTEIRRLPNSLCKLCNLQTLKLLRCLWLFELPKDFSNLVSLEHLELDDMFWQKSLTLPSNIGRLRKLQNLHAFRVGHEQGYGIDELKNMSHLKGSLHISNLQNATKTEEANLKDKRSLVKVIFEWSNRNNSSPQVGAKDREMIAGLQPHTEIEEIEILHYGGDGLPSWLRHSDVQNLTSLSLKHCKNCKILSLGELPHLRTLRLKGFVELESWSDAQYPNLCNLKINRCPKFKQMPSLFLTLRVLKIKKCDLLEALPITPSLEFLILVDNLNLKDFNETSVSWEISNNQGECIILSDPSFLELLEMKIINCPKIQKLPAIFAPQKLDISRCSLLTAVPPCPFASRLQHLSIDTCDDGRLVRAIPSTDSLYSLVISNIQDLSTFPRLPHLPGLRALYIQECNELDSLSDDGQPFQGLSSLQFLSIRRCPKLETLPENLLPTSLTCLIIGSCSSLKSLGPEDALKKLTSLRDLYIEDCPELESLPEEGFPTSLKHLRIQGCPLLMSRCHDSGTDWPKISNIPDLDLELESSINEVPSDQNSRAWYGRFICCTQGETSGGD